jgi:hypothetical protein
MQFDPKTAAAGIMRSFTRLRTRLAHYIRGVLAARRERLEHEREFYRNLTAYCDENNLPLIFEDDWKAAANAGSDTRHSQRNAKGSVL